MEKKQVREPGKKGKNVSDNKKPESILIKDTTPEQRQRIVLEALGMCGTDCEFCSGCENKGGGNIETIYKPYIDGEKEIAQINAEYSRGFVK